MTRIVAIYVFLLVFLLPFSRAYSQTCREKQKPYVAVWGYPRPLRMNLLDREYSRHLHFGFGMGVNAFDFSSIRTSGQTVNMQGQGNVILYADLVSLKPGFNLNAIADCRLVGGLNVRFTPGISFGNRQLDFYRSDTYGQIQSMPVTSNYLEFPLTLKYSAGRYSNFRPYILAGMNERVNLNSALNVDANRYVSMKKFEPFIETGLGFDFYLNYFRLSTEFKISMGLINCLGPDEAAGYEYYRQSLKSLHSNTVSFSLNFEL